MATKKDTLVWLACSECKRKTYHTSFSKKREEKQKLKELSKFCRYCRKHTPHNQVK